MSSKNNVICIYFASTLSSLTDRSGEVPSKGKCFLAKKPAPKRAKTEQMTKALELLQSTIENDPPPPPKNFCKF